MGGTQARGALVDERGNVIARREERTDAHGGPDRILSQIRGLVDAMLATSEPSNVVGIGVSAPGPIDAVAGVARNIPTSKALPLFRLALKMTVSPQRSADDARALIAAAKVKAEEIGVPMWIAVTDESGQLIAFERMDGGKITSTLIAQDKAFTAACAKRTTDSYGEASQPGKPAYGINIAMGGRLSIVAGEIWPTARSPALSLLVPEHQPKAANALPQRLIASSNRRSERARSAVCCFAHA